MAAVDARALCPMDDDIHALMAFKRALVEQYPLHEAFGWYCELRDLPDARLVAKSIVGMARYLRDRGAPFREIFPSGVPFDVSPPKVVGRGVVAPVSYWTRSFYVASVGDVTSRGRSGIIEVEDALLLDVEPREAADVRDNLDVDPAVFAFDGGIAYAIEAALERIHLDEAFVSLVGTFSDHFGHWLWQYLPKYLTAVASGDLPAVPILIDADMPPQHRQALEMLVRGTAPIVEIGGRQEAVVRRAWCAPMLAYIPLYQDVGERYPDHVTTLPSRYDATVSAMRSLAAETVAADRPSRVFLARRPSGNHDIANAGGIAALLASCGYAVVYPEEHSFEEQVAIVGHARRIVAADGSAIFLAFAAGPGAKICLLYQEECFGHAVSITSILEGAGLDVTLLTGKVVGERGIHFPISAHYEVDEALLREFLRSFD